LFSIFKKFCIIITGTGVFGGRLLEKLKGLEVGLIGEHICATRLLKLGIPAQIVHMGCSDIVAECNERLWRIQVKTSQLKLNGKKSLSYQFATCKGGKKVPLSFSDCDIVALVAFEIERVLFMPVGCLRNNITKRLRITTYDDDDIAAKSWQRCMAYYD